MLIAPAPLRNVRSLKRHCGKVVVSHVAGVMYAHARVRQVLLENPMIRIVLRGEIAEMVVFRREDLSRKVGANAAAEAESVLKEIAGQDGVRLLVDVSDGPPAFGPKTRASMCRILGAFTTQGRRAAVVLSDSATQALQYRSVAEEVGAAHICVTKAAAEAREWLSAPTGRHDEG